MGLGLRNPHRPGAPDVGRSQNGYATPAFLGPDCACQRMSVPGCMWSHWQQQLFPIVPQRRTFWGSRGERAGLARLVNASCGACTDLSVREEIVHIASPKPLGNSIFSCLRVWQLSLYSQEPLLPPLSVPRPVPAMRLSHSHSHEDLEGAHHHRCGREGGGGRHT